MSSTRLALLGAGQMGSALAARWVAAGRELTVWNRSPERARALAGKRVHIAEDLADAVRNTPTVASVLTDGAALVAVLVDQGAIQAMMPGSTLIDLSTVDVASSRIVAGEAEDHGIQYVRCGISGTAAVVGTGHAGLLVSGPDAAIRSVNEPLSEITDRQVVVGEAEEARLVKLAVNLMLAGTTQLLAEATVMAEASGLHRNTLLRALDQTVISSDFLRYKGAALSARNYEPTFTTGNMHKDVRLLVEQGEQVRIPMRLANDLLNQLALVCQGGWTDSDFLSLVRQVQKSAGRPVD
jgi:3-hydroxyisobutyrate dehydrogenase-like beta-hydroxyacid dehydrogenase